MAVSSASICSSDAFQALTGTRLGDSPIFMRALVEGDQVCIEYQLDASVASAAAWFGVGPSRGSSMVSSPAANVMMFFKDAGVPTSYLLGGYTNSDVSEESAQSSFVAGPASSATMSFSFQRTLAAASSSDIAISATEATSFIWAYGTSWPISTHQSGTNGAATFNIAAAATAGAAASSSITSSANTGWCADKNCPAIVGGATFGIMALCGLLLTAMLKSSPVGKLLLHRTVSRPPVKLTTNAAVALPHTTFLQLLADLHLGEVLVMLLFMAAVIVLIILLDDADNYVVSGQVSLLILMFLILPVARLPLWSVLFGSSFERIVKFHRWLGVAMNVAVIVHLIQASDVVDVTLSDQYGAVTPVHGFIAFLAFAAMLVLSQEFIRRRCFEVFYYTHRILSIVGFVFSILHAPRFIGRALIVPLALYALGVCYRWYSALTGSYKVSATVHAGSNSTTLVLQETHETGKLAMKVNPGSYYFVRLPAISLIEWHPFSSIVTPDGKTIGFTIKAMGNGSFTRTLMEKAGTQYELAANLCGPFGKMALDLDHYDTVVLVAGGVGITPMLSLINQTRLFPKATSATSKAFKSSDWYVLWSVREPEDILMMEQFLPTHAQMDYAAGIQDPNTAILGQNAPAPFHVHWLFHVSNAPSDGVVTRANGETVSYRGGKPILDELINTSRFHARNVTVVACGPPTMTVEAQSLARNCGFDFHKEVFKW
ncbi:hypothetical protein CCR75_004126 [Bremia lactucae]|uniref:Transmembrane protein n=1 Tax=Bremia lactucae TaxID=4779 RepID=A0A976ID14_BRELC|nr:hypothetical protein CCR75_004126 [Bremia lactucae]